MTTREVQNGANSSSTHCPTENYDALNRPTTWEQTGSNGFHALSHYQYDQMNREVATWRDQDGSRGERFTYEPTNQLSHIDYNAQNVSGGNPTNAERTVSYAYTPGKLNRDRMIETTGLGTLETNYAPNLLNQYTAVGGMSYQYDSNFNLTYTGAFSGVYDAANRLVSASNGGTGEAQQTVAGFVYDGLGRCVKRTLNGVATIFVYDGWKPIGEWDVWGYFQAWNVYGPGDDEILLRHWGKYGYLRFQLDRHGNVEFLLNNNGALLEKYKYDAFGKPAITDAADNPRAFSYYGHCFLFQGREYIWQLGVYDYRNRFYHPATGRFLQTDPTGFAAGDMNLFRYVNDDPIDGSDPTGLRSEIAGDRMWKSACFFDPGNSYQGSYNQFMGNSPAGGDGGSGGGGGNGGGKSSFARNEGPKGGYTMAQISRIDGHEVRRATPVHNIVAFDRAHDQINVFFSNGRRVSYPAGNYTTNPTGDPFTVGSHGPAPSGRWPLQAPRFYDASNPHSRLVGPAFIPIGAPGSLPAQRDVGLHSGTGSHLDLTDGCIRVSTQSMNRLLRSVDRNGPLEQIYIPR
ncbi:MAG: hypothetical protein QOC70_1541 [Verrucomicrobiota bacterium]|jgi:RHS repeat-associated protein